MTVKGIFLCIIICLIVLVIGGLISFAFWENDRIIACIITVVVTMGIIVAIIFGVKWYYSNTEVGKRALKTQESNFNDGISRVITIYDINGQILKTYDGKFDVETNGSEKKILFDDENGKRHIIYYTTGTVCIDEK